jgi:S1-C subfamily serine protease
VNFLDLVVVGAAALAAWSGARVGFVARAGAWLGLTAGLIAAVVAAPHVASWFDGSAPRTRLLVSLGLVVVGCVAGEALGSSAGTFAARRFHTLGGVATRADRVAGAALGAFGVLVLLWLLIPALAASPGWPAHAVRRSEVARLVDDVAPSPPQAAEDLGRLVGDRTFPEVIDSLTSPDAGDPPGQGVAAPVATAVERSTVRVEGVACDRIQDGSGFVAGPDLVATNAHVVAGETRPRVDTTDGRRLDAQVVAFDGQRDVAVLRVGGLGLPALGEAEGSVDETGALFGHPGGGPLRESPVRIAEEIVARGTDITHTVATSRHVFVLAAVTAPGDSGAPVVDGSGRVMGVLFAYDLARSTTAYALTRGELDAVLGPVLASPVSRPVGTGACLTD